MRGPMFVAATAADFGQVQQYSTKPEEFIVEYDSISEPDWNSDRPPIDIFSLQREMDSIIRSEIVTPVNTDDEVC